MLIESSYKDVITEEISSCVDMLESKDAFDLFDVVLTRLSGLAECFSGKEMDRFFYLVNNFSILKLSVDTVNKFNELLKNILGVLVSESFDNIKSIELLLDDLESVSVETKTGFVLSEEEKPVFLQEMVQMMNSIRCLLDSGDSNSCVENKLFFDVYKAAHTLKGFGGMISYDLMYVLSEYVEKLYLKIEQGEMFFNEQIAGILKSYLELLNIFYSLIDSDHKENVNIDEFLGLADKISEGNSELFLLYEKIINYCYNN